MVDGGRLLAKALKRHGIRYIFTLSGLQTQSIYNACIDEGITLIDTRHEASAVYMADGWARATGQPGVALLSAGPGMSNGITGIVNAAASSSPVVVIAGRSPLSQSGMGAFQELDQVALASPVSLYAATVYETHRIRESIDHAFAVATGGRSGPVYLDIPVDVLGGEVGEEEAVTGQDKTGENNTDLALLEPAVELLVTARNPVVVAGSGVRWSNAGDELKEILEMARIPLITVGMGNGCVPDDHPLNFGPVWTGLKEADVIMLVGAGLDYRLSFGQPPLFPSKAKILRVEIEHSYAVENRTVDIEIQGNPKLILSNMVRLLKEERKNGKREQWIEKWRNHAKAYEDRLSEGLYADQVPLHPLRVCREIRDFLDRDATVIVDGGDTTVFGRASLKSYYPGHWLDVDALWCIGTGLPFCIAAKLARPDTQALLLSGDGSFGFGVMEFATALKHDIPIVAVVNNDAAFGMIKHDQSDRYGVDRVIGTELGFVRYDLMVEAMGCYGEYVETPEEIRPAIERAFASGLPSCINVKVDPCLSSKGIFDFT